MRCHAPFVEGVGSPAMMRAATSPAYVNIIYGFIAHKLGEAASHLRAAHAPPFFIRHWRAFFRLNYFTPPSVACVAIH